MPTIATPVLPQGEVTFILRKQLGPQRVWSDFLADCIRGRTTFHGLTLLPTVRVRYRGSKRPVYDVRDVHKFVHDAIAASPPSTATPRLSTHMVEIDPADRRPWHLKILIPLTPGRPIATTPATGISS